MRNPERIERTLQLLHYIWREQPDTRFNQLIHNLQVEYATITGEHQETVYKKEEHKLFETFMKIRTYNLFNLEDEYFIKFLEDKVRDLWKI